MYLPSFALAARIGRPARTLGHGLARQSSPRAAARTPGSRRRHLGVATARLALALACASAALLPLPVAATALASASLNIASFSWYRDVGNDGNTANDVVLTTGTFGSGNTYQFAGADNVAAVRSSPDPASVTPPSVDAAAPGNSTGPLCAPGAGCTQAPSDYLPLVPPYPTESFYNAQAVRNGQFLRAVSNPATGSLSAGVRADVSLTEEVDASAETQANWTSLSSVRGNNGVNIPRTYFRIEFEAQRLAQTTSAGSSASADLLFLVSFNDVPWFIIDTANGIAAPTGPTVVYSFTTQGYWPITSLQTYKVDIIANASAAGQTTAVPLAPTPFLLATGMVWLVIRRSGWTAPRHRSA